MKRHKVFKHIRLRCIDFDHTQTFDYKTFKEVKGVEKEVIRSRMIMRSKEKDMYLPNELERVLMIEECDLENVEKNNKKRYKKKSEKKMRQSIRKKIRRRVRRRLRRRIRRRKIGRTEKRMRRMRRTMRR